MLFQGAKIMFDAIWEHLNTVLLKDPEEKASRAQQMLQNNDAFCNTRTAFYVGGESCMSTLNQYMSDRKFGRTFLFASVSFLFVVVFSNIKYCFV